LGLIADQKVELAKNMVDNMLYMIEHYGTVLNANRTYYLFRSQPPFLTCMIDEVFHVTKDKDWLAKSIPLLIKFHKFFSEELHQVPENPHLSRYYAYGTGPAHEVLDSERDESGKNHYERVKDFYRKNPNFDYGYDLTKFYDAKTDSLTDDFFKGDRSMRESGSFE
jgi:alpha,alpha-trehalase